MNVYNFEELEIWQLARSFTKYVFLITKNNDEFSRDYRFREQIRSSAGSIMDNIAEGFGREGNKEFINFLYIAKASNEESRSQLLRAFDFDYIDEEDLKKGLESNLVLSKKITNLIDYLKNSAVKGKRYKNP